MAVLQPVDAPRDLHGPRRIEVFNPATLERLGEIEVATAQDVGDCVARARAAQPAWAELGFEQRGRHLLRLRDVIVDRTDEIIDTICADTGKTRLEALATEILSSCDALTYYAKRSRKLLADRRLPLHLLKTKKLVLSYRPMGVVGIITPWNFPFILSLNPIVQALMAGNTVVLKPSEVTPFVGLKLAELFEQAGFPEEVLQVATGDGTTGAALVEAGCDKISFTGSVKTGRKIGEACGRQLVPCTLELGGKDPMVVCADADVERAAKGAVWSAFSNAGQVCMSTERVYVAESIAEPFTDRVVELTRALRQGLESEGEVDVGSLTFAPQLEVLERHLADSMDVMREESFGPLLPIQVVKDEDEAIRLANDTAYGLQASVWSRDGYKARTLANRIHAGGVTVDDAMVTYAATESPFGGVNDSGIGRVNGEIGLKGYCHVQSIVLPRFGIRAQAFGYPYKTSMVKQMKRVIKLLYRSPLGKLLGN
jgi:acyl-CoA reductase-like NAD-dependent aldehyde dehydrogenase